MHNDLSDISLTASDQDHHLACVPILIAPTFGNGTGLEDAKGVREAMMINPSHGFSDLKEKLRHTFFENRKYYEGGNLTSGKTAALSTAGIEVKEISTEGLGKPIIVHDGNVEAVLTIVGRRAPEMFLKVAFIKTA